MVGRIRWKAVWIGIAEKLSEIRFTKLFCFMRIAKKSGVGTCGFLTVIRWENRGGSNGLNVRIAGSFLPETRRSKDLKIVLFGSKSGY